MRRKGAFKSMAIIAAIAVVGLAAAVYVLMNQRLSPPITDTYRIETVLPTANGVAPGLGQPVTVSGVKVGSIVDAKVDQGLAVVGLLIQRKQLPAVYNDARATLEPITALNDMRIALDPGDQPARKLAEGGRIPLAQNQSPVSFDRVMASLDRDSRDYLQSLIVSVGAGQKGRKEDLKAAVASFWPTTKQVRRVAQGLAKRRAAISTLVSSLGQVTEAVTADDKLAQLVDGAGRTLQQVGANDASLSKTLELLPTTFAKTESTLTNVRKLTKQLPGANQDLTPVLRDAPETLNKLAELSQKVTPTVNDQLRPFLRNSQPTFSSLSRSAPSIKQAGIPLTKSLQVANYALNEFAYNPEGVKDEDGVKGSYEGALYGAAWFAHNWNSMFSTADAHGGMSRAMFVVSCYTITNALDLSDTFRQIYGKTSVCPGGVGADTSRVK